MENKPLMSKSPKFKIGDYVIIPALFQGGFKDVYVIEDVRLDLKEDLFIYNVIRTTSRDRRDLGDWLYETQIEGASEMAQALYE